MSKMYEQFKTDDNLETQGIWLDYGHFRIRIARAGGSNKKFQKAMESRTRPHRRAIQTETMDNDQATDLLRKVYADTIVLGWETKDEEGVLQPGIESPEGGIIPFNRDNVIATFENLPELFGQVQEDATKSALFRAQLLEEAGKNS